MLKCITFSGVDDSVDIGQLAELQHMYPFVEYGVLWSYKNGSSRYPNAAWIEKATEQGLNYSIHLCGKVARLLVEHLDVPEIPGKPKRIQINCNTMKGAVNWVGLLNVISPKMDFIIQTDGPIGAYWVGRAHSKNINASPLFDKSGGKGIVATDWDRPLPHTYNGYAGGIGPDNVVSVVKELNKFKCDFWIDMESKIRTDDNFDIQKCLEVIKLLEP